MFVVKRVRNWLERLSELIIFKVENRGACVKGGFKEKGERWGGQIKEIS